VRLTETNWDYLYQELEWMLPAKSQLLGLRMIESSAEILARHGVDLARLDLSQCLDQYVQDGQILLDLSSAYYFGEADDLFDSEGWAWFEALGCKLDLFPITTRQVNGQDPYGDRLELTLSEQWRVHVKAILVGSIVRDAEWCLMVRRIWAEVCDNTALLGFEAEGQISIPLNRH
jgi:hypothetical protein